MLPWVIRVPIHTNAYFHAYFYLVLILADFSFRDDIIFVVYLYQRWIYPVDLTRVNEYGQSFDVKEDKEAETNSLDSRTEKPMEEKKED
jgi:hypothetical protein